MPSELEIVDLSKDDDDRQAVTGASAAGPGPSTAAAARARRRKEIEVVELSDSDEEAQPWPLPAGGSTTSKANASRRKVKSFSSVELLDDDGVIALVSSPPRSAAARVAAARGTKSPVKAQVDPACDEHRAPTSSTPDPVVPQPEIAPAAAAQLRQAPAAHADQPKPPPPGALALLAAAQPAPPTDPADQPIPIAPYLADIAVLLPDIPPVRACAAVQSLLDEGVHARGEVVERAINDLLAQAADEVDVRGKEGDVGENQHDAGENYLQGETGNKELDAELDVAADPAPLPPLARPLSPGSDATTHLLLLLPDIDPAYARQTVDALMAKGFSAQGQIVDQAMDVLFALPKGYPKAAGGGGGKRKRAGSQGNGANNTRKKPRVNAVDYGDANRKRGVAVGTPEGKMYDELSIGVLSEAFGLVPVPHLRKEFARTHLFAPSYLSILKQSRMAVKPYKEKKTSTFTKGKERRGVCAEWERENEWLRAKLAADAAQRARELAEAEEQERLEESGMGIECQCCFGTVAFEKCGSCDDGHLFCVECVEGHAKNQIGSQVVEINCMDTSGCQAKFLEAELRRVLPAKLIGLWERLQQQKHIAAAGLENLATCPFCCEYQAIIDNPDEKLFRCQADDCGVTSCRSCKREEHLPKTCEEVARDDKVDHRHAVEEAMTQALIRKCPQSTCGTPTIKESGCNKMMCSSCRTMFCYCCAAIIKDYTHFNQNPANYAIPKDKAKCPLWDDLGERTAKELREAREKAKADLRAQGVDVDDSMDVALPDRPPPPSHLQQPHLVAQRPHVPAPLPNARAYAGLPARPPAQPQPAGFYGAPPAGLAVQRLAMFNAMPRQYQAPPPPAGPYGGAGYFHVLPNPAHQPPARQGAAGQPQPR